MNQVSKSLYGQSRDGHDVHQFTIRNRNIEVQLIEYGARMVDLKWYSDISAHSLLWSLPNLEAYEEDASYMGAIVGPVANRISDARYLDPNDGHTGIVTLVANEGKNQLHGGPQGLHQMHWKGAVISDPRGPSVRFTTLHGKDVDGHPGDLSIEVQYTLDQSDMLHIEMSARSTEVCPVSLTTHGYFQMAQNQQKQFLSIFSDTYLDTNAQQIPTGKIGSVKQYFSHLFDRSDVSQLNLDHTFIFPPDFDRPMARVESQDLIITVYANQPALQVYVATNQNGDQAVCLEPHGYVDAVNRPEFPSIMLEPTQQYQSSVRYHVYRNHIIDDSL